MLNKFMQEIHGTVVSVPGGDHLNVRVQPDAKSEVLSRVDDGAVLTILGEDTTGEDKWLLVTAGAKTGWVNAHYVKITDASCEEKS